jgi:hypothetical protein
MEIFLFWVILSGVVAFYASTKSRTVFGWFLSSLLLSPLITLVLLLILPAKGNSPLSLEGRLREIQRLKDDGVISEEEYQMKRKAIIQSN